LTEKYSNVFLHFKGAYLQYHSTTQYNFLNGDCVGNTPSTIFSAIYVC